MKYLFYDCEGANNFDKISKICSFGYVLCDSSFNVIDKNDLLINPEDKFEYKLFQKNSDIKLAYTKLEFYNSPNFKSRYSEIKRLLEMEDCVVVGFSLLNDIKYIIDGCKRYNLPLIKFKYLDVQEIHKRFYNLPHLYSLDNALTTLELEIPFNMHRSDVDAYSTMLILKNMLSLNNLSIDELLKSVSVSIKTIDDYINEFIKRTKQKEEKRKAYLERREKYRKLFSFYGENKNSGFLNGKKYKFSNSLFRKPDDIINVAKFIYENGGTLVKEDTNARVIYKDDKPTDENENNYISLEEFLNKTTIMSN